MKNDFEDKTKIELKQRYRELEETELAVEENEELNKILNELNFMD